MTYSDTNVELGMVPHGNGCRCNECEIESLRKRLQDMDEALGALSGLVRATVGNLSRAELISEYGMVGFHALQRAYEVLESAEKVS